MTIEALANGNLKQLTAMILELWPDCYYEEEFENCKSILKSEQECCFLAKDLDNYIGFIHSSLRTDYVEGSDTSPTAYIEALYVKKEFRKHGIAKKLLCFIEEWAKKKSCRQLASDTELNNVSGIEFHEKNQFNEVNRIVCFIKDI